VNEISQVEDLARRVLRPEPKQSLVTEFRDELGADGATYLVLEVFTTWDQGIVPWSRRLERRSARVPCDFGGPAASDRCHCYSPRDLATPAVCRALMDLLNDELARRPVVAPPRVPRGVEIQPSAASAESARAAPSAPPAPRPTGALYVNAPRAPSPCRGGFDRGGLPR
jgi:hypothetical protein